MYHEGKISGEISITHECSGIIPLCAERRALFLDCDRGIFDFRNTTNREVRQ
ncbi:MAG: hypothetical protein FWG13_05910 [Leptospirales bacterium]|nr:hypothetical protein [Leptospirales bacterium]